MRRIVEKDAERVKPVKKEEEQCEVVERERGMNAPATARARDSR